MSKTPKQLERYFKGVANHHRIAIMKLIAENDNITLQSISETTKISFKNASAHTAKLVAAGLVNKRYMSNFVVHSLSPYGETMLECLNKF